MRRAGRRSVRDRCSGRRLCGRRLYGSAWIRLETGVDGPVRVRHACGAGLVATDIGCRADGTLVGVEVAVDSCDRHQGAGVNNLASAHEVSTWDGERRVDEHRGGRAGERLELRGTESIDVLTVEVIVGDDAGGADGLGPTISGRRRGSSDGEGVVRHYESVGVVGTGVSHGEGVVSVLGVVGLKDGVVDDAHVSFLDQIFKQRN